MLYCFILLYYIKFWYIIVNLTFILLLLYNLFEGSNDKVRLSQLENSREKTLPESVLVEVATPSKVCFPLIYTLLGILFLLAIDGIRILKYNVFYYFFCMEVFIFSTVLLEPFLYGILVLMISLFNFYNLLVFFLFPLGFG